MSESQVVIQNVKTLSEGIKLEPTEPIINNGTLIDGIDTLAQAEEFYSSWALLILVALLTATLLVSYFLQRRKIRFIHESVVSIFMGIVVGAIIKIIDDSTLKSKLSFKYTIFFNLLLPPIILNSGYELDRKTFFKNFGIVTTFAFLGTTLSTIIIGTLVYGLTRIQLVGINMSLAECLMLGSILSSTDPVTVLAIFSQLKVDPKLYAIIFGESMLNDSVAIVLFESLQHVANKEMKASLVWEALGDFVISFLGSTVIGFLSGFATSLLLKFTKLHTIPTIETSLVTLLAYGTYFLSNSLQMSGIVSLLFCSIVLKHYAYNNLSKESQNTTTSIFRILAQLSENFCFIYLGIALFTSPVENYSFILVIFTIMFVCIARYFSIIPLSLIINKVQNLRGNKEEAVPNQYQMMLFWAGLRGAVAFALAMEMESTNASVMRSTILIVVVITVIFFGGTTPIFVNYLNIPTGIEPEPSPIQPNRDSIDLYSDGDIEEGRYHYNRVDNAIPIENDEDVSFDNNTKVLSAETNNHTILPARASFEGGNDWFNSIDDHILKPIFTHKKAPKYALEDDSDWERSTSRNSTRRDTDNELEFNSDHPKDDTNDTSKLNISS